MSYATPADVAAYLNRSLTSEQQTQAQFYLDAASAWIDQYTGKIWNPVSPRLERYILNVAHLYLGYKPVTAVTDVRVRLVEPNSTEIALGPEQYELIDPDRGIVSFDTGYIVGYAAYGGYPYPMYKGYIVLITYTHSLTTPANVRLAATIMASQKMNMSLNPMSQRLRSFSDNRSVSVTFKNDEVPSDVRMLLPPKPVVIV